jgi:hypothetical protein
MDLSVSELANKVEILEEQLKEQQVLLNNLILMIHLADTDLKNQLHLLDS